MSYQTNPKNKHKKSYENFSPSNQPSNQWAPSVSSVFKILMSVRLTSALWNNISDCDETFNYWEPLHYLLHGNGLQTWEYSPRFGIRSYFYLLLHSIPLKLFGLVNPQDKILQFYLLRCLLGALSVCCETLLYKTIKEKINNSERQCITLFFLLTFSPSLFLSSSSFLPSSFSMFTILFSYYFFLNSSSFFLPLFFVCFGSLYGWPFAVVLGFPIAFEMVFIQKKIFSFIFNSFFALLITMVPLVVVDSYFFGKFTIAPLNIIIYNVLNPHGSELYGIEPWNFYFINLFLNFNFAFPLALLGLLLFFVKFLIKKNFKNFTKDPLFMPVTSVALWILIFFTRPHKEERFMFPIYPFLLLLASQAFVSIQDFIIYSKNWFGQKKPNVSTEKSKGYFNFFSLTSILFYSTYIILSVSRVTALYRGYHAPLEIYSQISKHVSEDPYLQKFLSSHGNQPIHVCVGKEWHRFPSHFFLPQRCYLKFIKSGFRGQLPREFEGGTRVEHEDFNDLNLEETNRYVNSSSCQLLVDLDKGRGSKWEPNYSKMESKWNLISSHPFLISEKSHPFFRAFYVPFLSPIYTSYGSYNLLQTR